MIHGLCVIIAIKALKEDSSDSIAIHAKTSAFAKNALRKTKLICTRFKEKKYL
jgi:hypothetical protein